MTKTALFVIAALAVGFAVAASWLGVGREEAADPSAAAPALTGESAAQGEVSSVQARLERLEVALQEETARREALEGAVLALNEELAALGVERALPQETERAESSSSRGDRDRMEQRIGERFGFAAGSEALDRRINQLIEGGFSPDQAEGITRRESELRMDALYAQYEANRAGQAFDFRALDTRAALREELGDAGYERYLQATGQPTSIQVRRVLAGSPAENAGLRPGDQVIGYAGRRVFSVNDLNQLTLEGEPGQPVLMDVLREGQQIQIYVPRGPIGITGGGRAFFGVTSGSMGAR